MLGRLFLLQRSSKNYSKASSCASPCIEHAIIWLMPFRFFLSLSNPHLTTLLSRGEVNYHTWIQKSFPHETTIVSPSFLGIKREENLELQMPAFAFLLSHHLRWKIEIVYRRKCFLFFFRRVKDPLRCHHMALCSCFNFVEDRFITDYKPLFNVLSEKCQNSQFQFLNWPLFFCQLQHFLLSHPIVYDSTFGSSCFL